MTGKLSEEKSWDHIKCSPKTHRFEKGENKKNISN